MQKKILESMPYKLPTVKRRTAKDQYIYTAALLTIRGKDHLVVEIYPVRKSVTEPIGRMVLTETEYAIYITKSGMKLLTDQSLHNENPCWKQSGMVIEVQWYAMNPSVYAWTIVGKDVEPDVREDESVIKSCVEAWGLKQNRNIGILSILVYKDEIRRRKEQKRYQKRIDGIKEKQREVGEISAGFRSWALKIAGPQVLFYKTKTRKTAEVICSHCGKRYTVDKNTKKPVHGTEGKCRECKTTGVYISVGMKKRVVYDKETGLLQRGKINKKELVYRQFKVRKVCAVRVREAGEILTAETDIYLYEKYRSFLAAEGLKEHYNHSYGFENSNNWWDTNGYGYNALTIGPAALYPCGLNNTVKGTVMENSGINIMANRGAPFAITRYIDLYGYSCKVLESIVKVGLYKLTNDLLDNYYAKRHIDVTQISIRKALDIDRAGLKQLIRMDGGIKELRIIRHFRNLHDNLVRQMVTTCSNVEQIIAISKYVGVKKAVAYLAKQKRLLSAYDCTDLYEDYLRFAERLHYDLKDDFVLFPNNVRRAHDEAMTLIKNEETKEKQIRYAEYISEYKRKYEIADNKTKLQIIVPEQLQDIATEGKILHHCVGTYIESVANKQTVIVFIRRMEEPEKPYYTMEIKNDEIIQVRGARNCDPPAEVSAIVRKLKDRIKKRVDKAARELEAAETMAAAM